MVVALRPAHRHADHLPARIFGDIDALQAIGGCRDLAQRAPPVALRLRVGELLQERRRDVVAVGAAIAIDDHPSQRRGIALLGFAQAYRGSSVCVTFWHSSSPDLPDKKKDLKFKK